MTGTTANKSQPDIFRPLLTDFIDTDQELAILADRIDWDYFEKAFAGHYSHNGQPAISIRFMVGCLLLKRIYDYGDETLAKAWVMNPYMRQSHPLEGASKIMKAKTITYLRSCTAHKSNRTIWELFSLPTQINIEPKNCYVLHGCTLPVHTIATPFLVLKERLFKRKESKNR